MKEEDKQDRDQHASELNSLDAMLPVDEHIEEVSENGKKVVRRGVYLLPNLFTTAALFAGFYAIISGMHGKFEAAAIAIFVAMLLDGLDGRVARMTHTQSAFGAEYDSLSDMVSFGVAPALVMFSWSLSTLGKFGWAAAFVYVAGAALRLARFNTQVESTDKRYFTGLASPSAAAVLAGMVWVCYDEGLVGGQLSRHLAVLSAIVTIAVGTLMITNVQYRSFKDFDYKGRVPFIVILAVVFVFVVVTIDPPRILLFGFLLYAISGPAVGLWKKAVLR
jgi:CDP-diacylglycerol--serine O-phosphatidyltransferase